MKIHFKLVIDLNTGLVVDDIWTNYFGLVSLAKGGGGQTTSQTTTNTPTSQQGAAQQLGLQYLAPAFGSTATQDAEGKMSVSTPTSAFEPLTGVREQTWGQLQNTIPILQQQIQQISQTPSNLANFQVSQSPDLGAARNLLNQSFPDLSQARNTITQGGNQTAQERLASIFANLGSQVPGGAAAQNLAFQGGNQTTQERLAGNFA